MSERAARCTGLAGGVDGGLVDVARDGSAHARGERASERAGRNVNAHYNNNTVVVAVTLAHAHCRAPVHSGARAHARPRGALERSVRARSAHRCTGRRRLWCGDGRRASGKMSAHWSRRNMTWKIINMVRGGGGNCSSGQRSAAAARQCCRLTVKNIPPSPVSEMRFLPCTGAPLASPPHRQRRTPRPWCGFPSQTRPPAAAAAARLVTVPTHRQCRFLYDRICNNIVWG